MDAIVICNNKDFAGATVPVFSPQNDCRN